MRGLRAPAARRYFGTDGVRGVVGETLTPELVEKLGKAVGIWSGGGRILVVRDTRASGVELEGALARGIVSAGGTAALAGVLPTPAAALLRLDVGAVITASHNPPEYNGVKFFDGDGMKLSDAGEEELERLLDADPGTDERGSVERVETAREDYLAHVLEHFGSDLDGLRIGVDCANGSYSELAPHAFERLGADVTAIGVEPDGTNINVRVGATDLSALQRTVIENGLDLGVAFDGDGDRMLAVDERGAIVDGDQIVAILALDLEVDLVAVTVMANLGLHELMRRHDIRVVTTDVGDRYVLEALEREGGLLGGEQSGHVIYLRDHVTGDGLAAGLLLAGALRGRPLSEVAAVMQIFPQAKENVRVETKELTSALLDEVARVNEEWSGTGRVLVRPSGTEPVVRVLAEARDAGAAEEACARIATLVRRELG